VPTCLECSPLERLGLPNIHSERSTDVVEIERLAPKFIWAVLDRRHCAPLTLSAVPLQVVCKRLTICRSAAIWPLGGTEELSHVFPGLHDSGEGQEPFFSNPGDITAEFPFTICVEQLLALAVRLPDRGLTPEHKNVRFMTNPPFDDAANLSNQALCVGTSRQNCWFSRRKTTGCSSLPTASSGITTYWIGWTNGLSRTAPTTRSIFRRAPGIEFKN